MSETAKRAASGGYGPVPADQLISPHVDLRRSWGWMLAFGIVLILGGMAAIAAPVFASLAVEGVIGVFLIAGGVLQLVQAYSCSGWKARLWSILAGLVYLVGGVLLFINPLAGLVALTLIMIVTFLMEGGLRIAVGLGMRPERGWGWMTVGGVISLVMAVVLLALWSSSPALSLTLIGLLVAISLIFEGWACVFLALAARRAGSEDAGSPPDTTAS